MCKGTSIHKDSFDSLNIEFDKIIRSYQGNAAIQFNIARSKEIGKRIEQLENMPPPPMAKKAYNSEIATD